MSRKAFFSLLVVLLIVPALASADIPRTMSYQGVLTDAGGAVVPDGTYSVTFRLYATGTAGTPLWEETRNVQVNKGIFNVILGQYTPLDLDFSAKYFLGISVGGGDELTPRIELTSAPYSFASDLIKGTNYFSKDGKVGIGTSNPGYLLTVDGSAFPTNQVGIMFKGYNDYWSGIYTHAAKTTSKPIFGYMRNSILKASTYVDTTDYWVLHLSGSDIVRVTPGGSVGIGGQDPVEALDVDGAVKIGNTANSNAGTIRWTGSDFEGYDGSTWKSLTSSGGSGLPAGTYGQTLVSNGSAWVANSNLFNTGANVGIGTTSPDARLDVLGGNWDLDNTDGDVKIGNDDYKLEIGVATGGGGAGTAGIRMKGGLQRLILGGGSKEVMQIDTTGVVSIGSSTTSGTLSLFQGGSSHPAVEAFTNSFGGNINLYDEYGSSIGFLEADVHGEGGYLSVKGGGTSKFYIDGKNLSTGELHVGIEGTSDIYFDVGSTGDASVTLPNNAVSSLEMSNEPGIASIRNYSTSSLYMSSAQYYYIATRTFTAPSNGYALVIGSCFIVVPHTSGTQDYMDFGVSDAASFNGNPVKEIVIPSGEDSGSYRISVTVVGVFPVSAGSNTFRFLGYLFGGSCNVFDANLVEVFLPTAYGSVSSVKGTLTKAIDQPGAPVSDSNIVSEKAEAERYNVERLQKEVEELRRQVEALRSDNNKHARD